ncbi:MAG: hypothetical protein WBY97_13035, partial [Roseiarcus sp.]
YDARVRRDDQLGRDAAIGPGMVPHPCDEFAKAAGFGRIKEARDLRRMDLMSFGLMRVIRHLGHLGLLPRM